MKHFEIRLPRPKSGEAKIFVICCLHIGHRGHDKERALEYRDYILKEKDTYAISLGDDIDNAIPGDEKHNSMMFESVLSPEEQYRVACDYWRPLAEKGKILWTCDSNHWWRSESKTGISLAKQMNEFLKSNSENRSPEFGRWQSLAKILIGNQSYLIHSWHGNGGGKYPGGALKRCMDSSSYIDADCYLMGHHHKKIIYEDISIQWKEGKANPTQTKRSYGVTGSFLKWDDSYAERGGFPPSARGAIKVTVCSKSHDLKVEM